MIPEKLNDISTNDLTKIACLHGIKVPMHPGGNWTTVNRKKLIQFLAAHVAKNQA